MTNIIDFPCQGSCLPCNYAADWCYYCGEVVQACDGQLVSHRAQRKATMLERVAEDEPKPRKRWRRGRGG